MYSVREHHPPRFDINKDAKEILTYLDEHGYAVIASVATPEQISKARNEFWDTAEENRPGLKREDPTTWDDHWLGNSHTGIIGFGSFNHSDFLWNTRMLPDVRKAFECVWEVGPNEQMLVSFDGGNAFRPWKKNPLWTTDGGWWHIDQNARVGSDRTGRACIQGLVNYYDATAETGGLCVVPGSHRTHDALCARSDGARMGIDFVPISEGDEALVHGGELVCARAGDLIIWDSRTIHCNTPALTWASHFAAAAAEPPLDAGPAELIRLVAYVCMLPRRRVPAEILPRRRAAFLNRFPTSHWPDRAPPEPGPGGPPGRDPAKCPREMLDLVGFDRPGPWGCAVM